MTEMQFNLHIIFAGDLIYYVMMYDNIDVHV